MAQLIFSKIQKRYKDYRSYRPWLEENSFPKFCGYSWLIDQKSLSIDHYKPKEHYPKLKTEPDNLILCASSLNSAKGDYYPEVKDRGDHKDDTHYIFNYRTEDIGKYVKIKKDGSLTYRSLLHKKRFRFNEKVFKLNHIHNKEARKEYIYLLKHLDYMYNAIKEAKKEKESQYLEEAEIHLERLKKACSRRYIFYRLLNIKIPKYIEKLLTNQTAVKFD